MYKKHTLTHTFRWSYMCVCVHAHTYTNRKGILSFCVILRISKLTIKKLLVEEQRYTSKAYLVRKIKNTIFCSVLSINILLLIKEKKTKLPSINFQPMFTAIFFFNFPVLLSSFSISLLQLNNLPNLFV